MEKFAQNATMAESFLLLIPLSYLMWCTVHNWTSEWRIQGRGPGGLDPLLFLDQTEAQRAEKNFFGDPPPLSKVLDDCPPLISRSGCGIASIPYLHKELLSVLNLL